MKKLYAAVCLLLASHFAQAQVTIAFQGGEGTAADNWGFVAPSNAGGPLQPGIVNTLPRTGSFALRAGGGNTAGCSGGTNCIAGGGATSCPMHGNTLQFNAVNTTCLSGVQLTVYHRSHTLCAGSGFDGSDNLNFEVRLDGGAWTTINTMTAASDYVWSYATATAGSPANVPNPWVYNVPPGTNSFEFRVRATVNRSDEVFYLDDVRLTTTTTGYGFPGTAGLWNGMQDENWFNACNWDNRSVPTAATNVTFPVGSNNDIVIQSGQDCQCANLTLTGGAGRRIKAEGSAAKVLTCFGNLNLNTAAGSSALDFNDGLGGTPDGTLNLHGNWNNNATEADFDEGESTLNLIGTANQTISLAGAQAYEVFHNLVLNKPAGDVFLAKNVQLARVLTLMNGKLTTNAQHVYTASPAVGAVTGHSAASYVNGNLRRQIQTGTGVFTYDFPVGTAAHYELASLTFTDPAGVSFIDGFFNPSIGGTPPSVTEGSYTYNTILDAGVWTLTPSPSFTGTYDISLSERGHTNGGASAYIDVKRPDASAVWANPGTHVTFSEAGGTVNCQRSGLTSFSDFAIALSNTPLPIDGMRLVAVPQSDASVALDWRWEARVQGHFDLERSTESGTMAIGFWKIGREREMHTVDAGAPQGWLRYTLYHTDLNGTRERVATDEVWNTAAPSPAPRIWPNPTASGAHLQLGTKGTWQLDMVRIDGIQVMALKGEATDVEQAFETASAQLEPGMYVVRFVHGGKVFSSKLVRQ